MLLKHTLLFAALSATLLAQTQQPAPYAPIMGPQPASFDTGSYIEGTALSDAGELAYVVHSGDPANERTALVTSKRPVAHDGEVVEGKTLTRIWASALAINARGHVAFEADYKDANGTSARGIFLDNHFLTAIRSEGTPSDFALTPDGRVVVKPGIAFTPPVHVAAAPTPQTAANQKPTTNCTADGKPQPVPTVMRSAWARARASIGKATGVDIGTVDEAARAAQQANCNPSPK